MAQTPIPPDDVRYGTSADHSVTRALFMFMRRTRTEQLVHDLQALVKQAEELVNVTTDNTSEAVAEARSRTEKTLHAARKSVEKLEQRVVAQARHAAHETDTYVHENPWVSIGAAASVGVLVGLLLARR
jgi:ElaB/YqjD/DUF883 family membrane-anchored ribosome-binding protein